MADRFIGNIKGKDAQQPNFSFVAPDTLPSGAQATIQNLGSPQNPVLKFGIPAGSQGAPGASVTGPRGEQGLPGTDGAPGRAATINIHGTTLVDAEEDIRVENRGTSQDVELEFFLKRPPEEITIDEELIENSTNPVQSKAIQEALAEKADSSSIPTKLSELTNDQNYVSEPSVNVMIEDAVAAAASTANPVDAELSDTSVNAVQNKVINSALADKVEMDIAEAVDNNNVQYGEVVTLRNSEREVSMVLTGDNIESVVLSQNFAERIPTIVSELPMEGSVEKLYLVPSENNNYFMHIWMNVDGIEKWVNIQNKEKGDIIIDESRESAGIRTGYSIYRIGNVVFLDVVDYVLSYSDEDKMLVLPDDIKPHLIFGHNIYGYNITNNEQVEIWFNRGFGRFSLKRNIPNCSVAFSTFWLV